MRFHMMVVATAEQIVGTKKMALKMLFPFTFPHKTFAVSKAKAIEMRCPMHMMKAFLMEFQNSAPSGEKI